MRDAWSLLGALAAATILGWVEYHRRRIQHLRPMFMTGTLHRRNHRPRTDRIDHG